MIAHVLGLDNASGPWYLFWSGFGADLGLFGGLLLIVIRHNCHARSCFRIARYSEGNHFVCKRHRKEVSEVLL